MYICMYMYIDAADFWLNDAGLIFKFYRILKVSCLPTATNNNGIVSVVIKRYQFHSISKYQYS
jgi:hypothetical protein